MAIENTTQQGERGWTMGRNPAAIKAQEAEGQRQLVADAALPVDGLEKMPAAWGVKVIGPRKDDPLFADVTLPQGWAKRATDHPMWSELTDATGTVRARIFYKAAYYDRRAFISF